MWSHLDRGSSPIDWCEENYTFSPHIAEFINTVSNFLFLLMPPFLIHLHRDYARHCGRGIYFVWVLMMIVGVCSAYFHATLSLLGQLLDELAILWVVMACYWLWYPESALPRRWKNQPQGRRKFSNIFIVFAFIVSFLGFIQPAANAFCLMLLLFPSLLLMGLQLRKEEDKRIINLGQRSIGLIGLALTAWINDRFFCSYWAEVGFPYLHGVWHILIFLSSYSSIVLFAYCDVVNHMPHKLPALMYYPISSWQLGVPYVHVRDRPTERVDYTESQML